MWQAYLSCDGMESKLTCNQCKSLTSLLMDPLTKPLTDPLTHRLNTGGWTCHIPQCSYGKDLLLVTLEGGTCSCATWHAH
jgi:hypothetical protein